MILLPLLKSSIMESFAAVNAGACRELFLRRLIESADAIESALNVESFTARKESERAGAAAVSAEISASALAARLARLLFWEYASKVHKASIIINAMHAFAVHLADITLLYMTINYILVLFALQ
jgi:hypothetical protein